MQPRPYRSDEGAALEQKVDEQGRQLDRIELEVLRSRRRLHRLETDRTSLRMLARATKDLAERTNRTLDQVDEHLDRVAERAVEASERRRAKERREDWKYRLGWVASLVMAAGFLVEHHIFG